MSDKTKYEIKLSIISILITLAGSIMGTIWMSAKLAHQVEVNTEHLRKVDEKITTIATHLLEKERK